MRSFGTVTDGKSDKPHSRDNTGSPALFSFVAFWAFANIEHSNPEVIAIELRMGRTAGVW
jgi:hypothetical protein